MSLIISNVQNLAGIDITLQWNPSVLGLSNVALNLGVESHSNGVLHGTKINYNGNSLSSGDIYVLETKVSGTYELAAQSIGASNPGFSGSGTIATLTFDVLSTGAAGLSLQTDLADHPAYGQTANNINHQDMADTVIAVVAGASGTTASPTSTLAPTPTTPEFPSKILLALFVFLVTASIFLAAKQVNKKKSCTNQRDSLEIRLTLLLV